MAGTSVLVAHPDDEIEDLKQEVMEDFTKVMQGFKREAVGVYVQASTCSTSRPFAHYHI